jgi:hypothetical protein
MSEASTGTNMLSNGYVVVGCGIVAVILYITSFVLTSKAIGDSDRWNHLQSAIPGILGPTIAGGFVMFIALMMYIYQMENQKHVMYIVVGVSSLALCMAFASIAIAVIVQSK